MSAEKKVYNWLQDYEKPWINVREDENGLLVINRDEVVGSKIEKAKVSRHKRNFKQSIRYLIVMVDGSESQLVGDYQPNRLMCVLELLKRFVSNYFKSFPLSQVSVCVFYNNQVSVVCRLSNMWSEVEKELDALVSSEEKCLKMVQQSSISISNGLTYCMDTFANSCPSTLYKEVLFVTSNMTTVDPTDIYEVIEKSRKNKVIVNSISLTAQIHIYSFMCERTGGNAHVATDQHHLLECMNSVIDSEYDVMTQEEKTQLIRLGFPQLTRERKRLVMCAQHEENKSCKEDEYYCVVCSSKYCELPVKCSTCKLLLVMAPHLVRSKMAANKRIGFGLVKNKQRAACEMCTEGMGEGCYECEGCGMRVCEDCFGDTDEVHGFCVNCI